MDPEIERVALKVTDDRMAEVLAISVRHGAEMRIGRRSRFFYPKMVGDGKFEIPPVTIGANYQLNVCEQKNADGSADIICSTKGKRMVPFWIMDDGSQSSCGVHVRFPSYGPVIKVHVDSFGRGHLERIWHEVDSEYAYVRKTSMCPFTLERDGSGKVLFSEDLIRSNPRLGKFRNGLKAAVRKVNSKDGVGPQFFEEPFQSMVRIRDGSGSTENYAVSRDGQVISAQRGMSMAEAQGR